MTGTLVEYEAPVCINTGDVIYGIALAERKEEWEGSTCKLRVCHYVVKRFNVCGVSAETGTESISASKILPKVTFSAFRRYGRKPQDFARITFAPHQIDPVAVKNESSVFTSYRKACELADTLNAEQASALTAYNLAHDTHIIVEWKEANDKEVQR